MQQIADWLESLGMSEYAQRFADDDIDFAILGDLTRSRPEKIGVTSLGHRRKLLRAIANLEPLYVYRPSGRRGHPQARSLARRPRSWRERH
jgi:SAM domain (Sterile alpha motif)